MTSGVRLHFISLGRVLQIKTCYNYVYCSAVRADPVRDPISDRIMSACLSPNALRSASSPAL